MQSSTLKSNDLKSSDLQTHRFYQNEFPELHEIVVVKVIKITDEYITVALLEYNNIEGLISINNVSRRKLKLQLDNICCCEVIYIDPVKSFIDLSKKTVNDGDMEICMEKYYYNITAHSIIYRIFLHTNEPIENLYRDIIWKLNDSSMKNQASLDENKLNDSSMKNQASLDESKLNDSSMKNQASLENRLPHEIESLDLSDNVRKVLIETCKMAFRENKTMFKKKIKITNFKKDGVLFIKSALSICEKYNTIAKLISSPCYMLECENEDNINKCIEDIKKDIENNGGEICVVEN